MQTQAMNANLRFLKSMSAKCNLGGEREHKKERTRPSMFNNNGV